MRVVQVLGTNGAGKSTLLRALVQRDGAPSLHHRDLLGAPGGLFTVLARLHLVLVGDYVRANNTPGADRLRSKRHLLEALDHAVELAQAFEAHMVWEGIILMTRQYLPEYLARGLTPLYIVLDVLDETAFERLALRSGRPRTELKHQGGIVVARAKSVRRLAEWLAIQRGAEVVWLTSALSPEKMAQCVVEELAAHDHV